MLDEGTVVGSYRVEALLGRGGMGTVFRARHAESGRVVALKVLSGSADADAGRDARLLREGRAQASLEHPHVVAIYDAGESEHGLYLAMRLVDGPRLADLIASRQLDARRALALLDQVADALDAAHAAGLVHRDVKPLNVLVGSGDHAYLADFGLTRADGATAATVAGGLAGTVAYLAPEVVRGAEATAASDRYAFAAMAFECLTGSVVFSRTSEAGVLFAQANDPPPRIGARRSELGDGLDALFSRALAKEPAERPGSARALMASLRGALEAAGLADLPAPPPIGAAALAPGAGAETATSAAGHARAKRRGAAAGARGRIVALTALAALAGAAIAVGAWALLDGPDDAPAQPLTADRPGLTYVGSTLDGESGRALDCRGRAPQDDSPPCTIAQSDLPGATLVVPANGVIREWSVRAARGELTLVVLRPRDGGAFQVTMSATETAGSADVQRFATDLAVDRGDLVALRVSRGGAFGVAEGVPGATTERWLPPLAGAIRRADRGPGSGLDAELLLRVGIVPGGGRRLPPQTTGSAAVRLPAGRVLAHRAIRFEQGGGIAIALVRADGGFALDASAMVPTHGRGAGSADSGRRGAGRDQRRYARIEVPDMRRGAEIVRFAVALWGPESGGVDLHFVNADSSRVITRGYAVDARQFELIR